MKAIILAGGGGTRLWPVSRRRSPKQVEAIVGDRSLLQATYDRLRRAFKPQDILVAAAEAQRAKVAAQLPRLPLANLILEPYRRDTASAIGFALLQAARRDPDDNFAVIYSDAYVKDVDEYLRVIRSADQVVASHPDRILLIGIKPSYPETGYGYIRTGPLVQKRRTGGRTDFVFKLDRFIEKPSLDKAREYLAHGGYLWNPGLIVGRIGRFLSLYERDLPEHARIFTAMKKSFGLRGETAAVRRLFKKLPSISVDYGILEKQKGLLVMPADFGWADVGNWRTVRDVLAADPDANVVKGLHVGIDSRGNLIYGRPGKLMATVGVHGMVIIDTGDTVLVCPQDRAQDVKKLVAELEGCSRYRKYS